jgi:hypothetical protein
MDSVALGEMSDHAEAQLRSRRDAEARLKTLIKRIQTKEGFTNFLRPPSEREMKATADAGPTVVINLSSYRCDAIFITSERISFLNLPKLNLKDIQANIDSLRSTRSSLTASMLAWLWEAVACPCLEELRIIKPIFWRPMAACTVDTHWSTQPVPDTCSRTLWRGLRRNCS